MKTKAFDHAIALINETDKSLNFENEPIDLERMQVIVKTLEQNKNIQCVELINCEIDNVTLKELATYLKNNSQILKLDLSHNVLTQEGGHYLTEALAQNTTLEELILTGNQIAAASLHMLHTLSTHQFSALKVLVLRGNSIPNSMQENWVDEKNFYNTKLKQIDLCTNYLSDLAHILPTLIRFKSLKTLHLSYNFFSDKDMKDLSNLIKDTNLKELVIDNNSFREISPLLDDTFALTSLNICDTSLVLNQNFYKALSNNMHLKMLHLRNINIDIQNYNHLLSALEKNTTLKYLDLSNNDLIDDSCVNLALSLLQFNITLKFIILMNDTISSSQLEKLFESYQCNWDPNPITKVNKIAKAKNKYVDVVPHLVKISLFAVKTYHKEGRLSYKDKNITLQPDDTYPLPVELNSLVFKAKLFLE